MGKPSLLLITVDCLRADHVGFEGYRGGTTPCLDSLAPQSFTFPKAFVAGAPTYFSFPAIMASRYPLGLGRDVLGIAPQEPTLATSLHRAGYATAAFVAANPYLSAHHGYQQGFDTYVDFLEFEISALKSESSPGLLTRFNRKLHTASRRTASISAVYDEAYFRYCQWCSNRHPATMDDLRRYPAADILVDQARAWVSSLSEQPFFLWLHFMDPHHPYYPPEQALRDSGNGHIDAGRARFLNSFWNRGDVGVRRLTRYRDEILGLYDAGVSWVDKQIARFVTALKLLRRWDDTVLALTGDHGELFLENGDRYHSPTDLPDSLIHVPLMIRVPNVQGTRQPETPFSLIDLPPTLLQIMNVDSPENFRGSGRWQAVKAGTLPDTPVFIECVEACSNPIQIKDRLHPRMLAVRDSFYQLVINFRDQSERFFDVRGKSAHSIPLGVCQAERARLLRFAQQHLKQARTGIDERLRLRAKLRDLTHSLAVTDNSAESGEQMSVAV